MKLLAAAPDGGKNSGVTAYFLFESKRFGSIALLRFDKGSREAYHSHAFNAWTWWLKGRVIEHFKQRYFGALVWRPSWRPKYTPRHCFHKIQALEVTWALTVRGPWVSTWQEQRKGKLVTLTHGRKEIS